VEEQQTHHIQATRANARALDEDRSVSIDSRRVDEYLLENGVATSEFTVDQPTAVENVGEDDDDDDEGGQTTFAY
jgi:hypothetical protein